MYSGIVSSITKYDSKSCKSLYIVQKPCNLTKTFAFDLLIQNVLLVYAKWHHIVHKVNDWTLTFFNFHAMNEII